MAIDAADLFLLIEEAKARPFSGAILTLGRQDVTVTGQTLATLAALDRHSLSQKRPITVPMVRELLAHRGM